MSKTDLKASLKTLCQKHGFGLANYYKLQDKILSCKEQEFFISDSRMGEFLAESPKYSFKVGASLIGRVFETANYEWCPNV